MNWWTSVIIRHARILSLPMFRGINWGNTCHIHMGSQSYPIVKDHPYQWSDVGKSLFLTLCTLYYTHCTLYYTSNTLYYTYRCLTSLQSWIVAMSNWVLLRSNWGRGCGQNPVCVQPNTEEILSLISEVLAAQNLWVYGRKWIWRTESFQCGKISTYNQSTVSIWEQGWSREVWVPYRRTGQTWFHYR